MRGILLKEWYLTKISFKMLLFLSVAFIVAGLGVNESNISVSVMVPIIFSMQIMNTFNYDVQSRFSVYAMTLPVSNRTYVLSKYIFSFGLIVVAILLEGIYLLLLRLIYGSVPLFILFSIGMFSYFSILFSLFIIPILFRFGTEKTRLIITIMFLLVTILVAGMSGMIRYNMWQLSSIQASILIPLAMVSLLLVVGIISYKLSMKWFKTK